MLALISWTKSSVELESLPIECCMCSNGDDDIITAGTRTRRRDVKRAAVRPHGQCLSELVQRQPCLLDPCYTYTNMVNKAEREAICVRSDGLIVEGKLLQSSTCPNLNITYFVATSTLAPPNL